MFTEITLCAFKDELNKIKEAGIGSFLSSGVKGWGNLLAGRGSSAAAQKAGGTFGHMKQIWGAGANKVTDGVAGGFMGGLGALARSRYGQMAAIPALGYAGYKVLNRDRPQGQY